jgi:hypothetical protein
LPIVPNSTYGDAPVPGLIRFNQNPSTSSYPRIEIYYNGSWQQVAPVGSVQLVVDNIGTSDGVTTQVFTMSQSEGTDPTRIAVFVGGVYQLPNINYSVSGTNLIFTSVPPAPTSVSPNQIVVIHNINSTNVAV